MQHTILVVDDDPDLLTAHRLILERAGHRVLTASDGHSGLRLALELHPDMIILDLLMPKLNGFRVLEKIRESRGDDARVIMLTGNGAQAHRDWASFLGVDDYLEKPVTSEELLEAIERCSCSLVR